MNYGGEGDGKAHHEKVDRSLLLKRILSVGRRDHCLNTGRFNVHCDGKELPFMPMGLLECSWIVREFRKRDPSIFLDLTEI